MKHLFSLLILSLSVMTAHAMANDFGVVSVWAHESIRDGSHDHVLELKVYVEGRYRGMIKNAFPEMEECNLPGAVTFKLRPGEHQIEVRGIHRDPQNHNRQQTIHWGGTFSVQAGVCNMIKVGKDESPILVEDNCDTVGEIAIYLEDGIQEHLRDIKIYIDGEYAASLNTYHTSERSCGDMGVLTRKLSCGPHTVEIVGIRKNPTPQEPREYRATSSFVLDGQCLMLPLDY